jgi:hypothetical protein
MSWHRRMTGAETQTTTRKQEDAAMIPPRLGCALGTAEVQSSRNIDVVYTQINERYFLFAGYARSAGETREPGDETARAGKSTRRLASSAAVFRLTCPSGTRTLSPVHAVVATVRITDPGLARAALADLRVDLVPRAPGFVRAYWLEPIDGVGMSVIVFETREHAEQAVAYPLSPLPGVTPLTREIREVYASA